MARHWDAKDNLIYRVVWYKEGKPPVIYGPYYTLGTAKSFKSRLQNEIKKYLTTAKWEEYYSDVEVYLEVATVKWEEV